MLKIFATIPEKQTENFLNSFNFIKEKLKFTIGKKYHHTLNFLNITLIRTNNKMKTPRYAKSIRSDRLMNFNLTHRTQHKNESLQ